MVQGLPDFFMRSRSVRAGSSAAPDEIKLPLSIDESVLPLRGSKPRARTSWIWTALLSAMILLAILLGLVAISH